MIISKQILYLITSVLFGFLGNSILRSTNGFTKIKNVICSCSSFLIALWAMSKLMQINQLGPIYAIYAASITILMYFYGLLIYKEIPNYYSIIGTIFIIIGVFLVHSR